MMNFYTRKYPIDSMAAHAIGYAAVFAAGLIAGVLFASALGGLESVIQAITDALS
jgi:hypothetical protein